MQHAKHSTLVNMHHAVPLDKRELPQTVCCHLGVQHMIPEYTKLRHPSGEAFPKRKEQANIAERV